MTLRLPPPPYYAVVFSSKRTAGDGGYERMSAQMMALALAQPGCLGAESARGEDGVGITVSYWADEASILAWKALAAHLSAQHLGHDRWYEWYDVRVARVERAYSSGTTRLKSKPPTHQSEPT